MIAILPPPALPPGDVEVRIRRFFREQVNVDVPSADTDLFETGALDSLGLVGLLVVLEEELGRRISLAQLEIADFRSIAQIVRVVGADGPPS